MIKEEEKKESNLSKETKLQKIFCKELISLNLKVLTLHIYHQWKNIKNLLFQNGKFLEQFFSKISNIGIRPLSVFQFNTQINASDYVVSFTDGFSLSLGFYYYFINKKNKIKLVAHSIGCLIIIQSYHYF